MAYVFSLRPSQPNSTSSRGWGTCAWLLAAVEHSNLLKQLKGSKEVVLEHLVQMKGLDVVELQTSTFHGGTVVPETQQKDDAEGFKSAGPSLTAANVPPGRCSETQLPSRDCFSAVKGQRRDRDDTVVTLQMRSEAEQLIRNTYRILHDVQRVGVRPEYWSQNRYRSLCVLADKVRKHNDIDAFDALLTEFDSAPSFDLADAFGTGPAFDDLLGACMWVEDLITRVIKKGAVDAFKALLAELTSAPTFHLTDAWATGDAFRSLLRTCLLHRVEGRLIRLFTDLDSAPSFNLTGALDTGPAFNNLLYSCLLNPEDGATRLSTLIHRLDAVTVHACPHFGLGPASADPDFHHLLTVCLQTS